MTKTSALEWIINIDKEATILHYEDSSTDLCDCANCRNYVAAFPQHFPKQFFQILQIIAINPLKPAHISEVCKDKNNNHMYIGNYDFIGTILKEPNDQPQRREKFSLDILGKAPKLNLQFSVIIPWILDEESESVPC